MRVRPGFVALLGALLALGCGAGGTEERPAVPAGDEVVVASFQFPESVLLGEIYAQALEDEGVEVRRELGLGSRELVLPALRRGLVDVVPEYAGSALDATAYATGAAPDGDDVGQVVTALRDALDPWNLTALAPSTASNVNVVAVRAPFAERRRLRTISDLAPLAATSRIGGPPECPQRPRCLPGLAERYGLRFAEFVPLADSGLVASALADDVIDVGVLFSTDAELAGQDLAVLADDRQLQPPDEVVPVVRSEVLDDERVRPTLDEVSARLSTPGLRFLNWRLANAGTDAATEARGWLIRNGLVDR